MKEKVGFLAKQWFRFKETISLMTIVSSLVNMFLLLTLNLGVFQIDITLQQVVLLFGVLLLIIWVAGYILDRTGFFETYREMDYTRKENVAWDHRSRINGIRYSLYQKMTVEELKELLRDEYRWLYREESPDLEKEIPK